MDGAGTPLRTWEKLYWGLFVAGLATLMFSRLYRSQPPDPKARLLKTHTSEHGFVHACSRLHCLQFESPCYTVMKSSISDEMSGLSDEPATL